MKFILAGPLWRRKIPAQNNYYFLKKVAETKFSSFLNIVVYATFFSITSNWSNNQA